MRKPHRYFFLFTAPTKTKDRESSIESHFDKLLQEGDRCLLTTSKNRSHKYTLPKGFSMKGKMSSYALLHTSTQDSE